MTGAKNKVAIIGGGFSGAMVALHLLRQTQQPLALTIIEPRAELGRGLAYSTDCDEHLLNVPAAGMSALAEDPDHFLHYANTRLSGIKPETFVPRKFFGKYVNELVTLALRDTDSTVKHIKSKAIDLVPITNPTDKMSANYTLTLEDNETFDADVVVLALGNLAGNKPKWLGDFDMDSDCYIHNPWDKAKLSKIKADDDVLIVGTGLTAVDKVLELLQNNHKGNVIAVSRHGLIPREHLDIPDLHPAQMPLSELGVSKSSVVETLHFVRHQIKHHDWRPAVDGLRSITQEWWHNLELPQKRKFARYLQTYWDVHRHRMAPVIARKVQAMQERGQLVIVGGRLAQVIAHEGKARVQIATRGSNELQEYTVKKVLNCTGPQASPRAVDSALLSKLYERRLVDLHPTKLGINCTENGNVIAPDGEINETLFAIGPMLKATLLESVAVPEIKFQTRRIASAALYALTHDYEGARELNERCGGWQNFHDAEILEFLFRPTGVSELKILLEPWRSEERVCGKKIMVVFKFSEFERLDLRDFESQNIIDELQIEKSGDLYTIELHAGDGLGGTITARNLSVECHDIDA